MPVSEVEKRLAALEKAETHRARKEQKTLENQDRHPTAAKKPEPLIEKLVGGGVSRFFTSDVFDVTETPDCTLVTLKSGERLSLVNETLNATIPGTTVIDRRTTAQRVAVAAGLEVA